jgi:hypothetical protein
MLELLKHTGRDKAVWIGMSRLSRQTVRTKKVQVTIGAVAQSGHLPPSILSTASQLPAFVFLMA